MNIHPDGSFEITEQKLTLFEQSLYSECVEIFEQARRNKENIKGVIRDSSGSINIIKDTKQVTIPEIFKLKEELESGNSALRNAAKRDELLTSVTEIKTFEQGDAKYYFVGAKGREMKRSLPNAANIRRIEPYKDSPLMFDRLLPLMNVTFVHNGQLTVVPFPFKYLREYVRTIRR